MGVGPTGYAVYLDFRDAIKRDGESVIRQKYGNLFQMYERITDQNPYETPMMIYPAIHYVMGGLWVDYNLMSTIPGLFVLGEANFSDHGSNRLGASALMQGLADGYFIIPYTIGGYFAGTPLEKVDESHLAFRESTKQVTETLEKLISIRGKRTVDDFHKELGSLLWENCGMARNDTDMLKAKQRIPELREEFWKNVTVPGTPGQFNQSLERAGRVADYLEFAELLVEDALTREESCGCHFNVDYQTAEHEAQRDDEEPLVFENVELTERSYK
jgi:succinate dehydrogenase / fumarate reductase flavoprotein subunit